MPSAAGIGLVALDIVIDEKTDAQIGESAGGSCGNVMAILAYLGWAAAPIARLDDSAQSRRIKADLRRWNVEPRWLSLAPHAPAPVYIERLGYNDAGVARHRFERHCPECGGRLPQYRPVTREALRPLLPKISASDVLYVDRPSPGAVLAAEHARDHGGFVYFEPSARGDQRHLARIAACATIVKYSADRLTADDRSIIAAARPPLEIETRGSAGLRYRSQEATWRSLPAPPTAVKDTAGAGDWMTAGLLHGLFADRSPRGQDITHPAKPLAAAQALAAFSCGFVGARGAMDSHAAEETLASAAALVAGDRHAARQRRTTSTRAVAAFSCGAC